MNRQATEILVNGIVQGVGFRPFVYRLAKRYHLEGFITNSGSGVVIRVAGSRTDIDALVHSLQSEAPPLAHIVSLRQQESSMPETVTGFSILASESGKKSNTHVSPDTATCRDCLREIRNPSDRRFRYPFTNCTNCGPRYTIIRSLPYDRPRTTMESFTMCPECLAEYTDPADRRFHAQPNGCSLCGPGLKWYDKKGNPVHLDDPLSRAAESLQHGAIIGIKGLGGFHLATDGFSAETVDLLRQRKNRPCKPLAVMVSNLETAKRLCVVGKTEEKLLTSPSCPIVLLQKQPASGLARNLAPSIEELGVMLPYTPLHHLLFSQPGTPECLVMTSGNAAGDPLCRDNDEAARRLSSFCDGFLMHNRDIHTRVDDSVVRMIGGKPKFLRRSRGYAPAPVLLGSDVVPILAVGGELKNCFCLARKRDAFMSQHIGDMNNLSTLDFFEETYERLTTLLEIEPQCVAADLHPDYLSTGFALETGLPVTRIQHHWAHAASVMAEHGLTETLAIILDGTGFGPDKTIWGGEVLRCSLQGYERLGRLSPLHLPGGDMAARQPWRMGLAALHASGITDSRASVHLADIPANEQKFILDMIAGEMNSPLTSSCGRLFDGVSSLLGICQRNTFEGQAAMELESLAAQRLGSASLADSDSFTALCTAQLFQERKGLQEISTELCIHHIAEKIIAGGVPTGDLALFFHEFLVASLGNMVVYLSEQAGIRSIVFSGGCAQNRILAEGFFDFFSHTHLTLFTNRQVPANDGGLALGQAIIGGIHVSCDSHAGQ
jgi:hydrogenase maturation protein HypF